MDHAKVISAVDLFREATSALKYAQTTWTALDLRKTQADIDLDEALRVYKIRRQELLDICQSEVE